MKINLTQPEIETAIKNYLKTFINMPGCEFQIEMSATRGAAGFIADVTITKAGSEQPAPVVEPKPSVDTETGEVQQEPKRQSLFAGLKS